MTAREHRDEIFTMIGQEKAGVEAHRRLLWLLVSVYSDPDESARIREDNLTEHEKEILRQQSGMFVIHFLAHQVTAFSLKGEMAHRRVYQAGCALFRVELFPLILEQADHLARYTSSLASMYELHSGIFDEVAARAAIVNEGFPEEKVEQMLAYCRQVYAAQLTRPLNRGGIEREYDLAD